MVIGFIVGAIVVGVIAAFLFRPKSPSMDMAPASLDSFSITQASEGAVICVVYGRARVTGNIIWYGNLETEEVKSEGGGKGGGGDDQVVGYKYWLDVWEAICMGKVTIIDKYVNDVNKELTSAIETFNDGTEEDYPTQPGANANRLHGVAHIFWDRLYLGENQTFVPTVHFIVEGDMSGSPVSYAVMTKGINPAAIIYDLLIEAGESGSNIVLADFNTAATYWNTKGYALNIKFSQQGKLRDKIAQVLSYVDGVYGINEENKHTIKAYDPDDTSEATLDREDFIEFTFTRKSWYDTYNEFRGNYIDEDQDYTTRTLVARNGANIRIQGRKRLRSVDLTAYRDLDIASKRLWEIMKKESYPDAQISFKTNLEFDGLNVGSVIEVNNSDYGISSAEFRIITKDVAEVDQNVLGWRAIQMIETLFDDNYLPGGNPGWIAPDYTPDKLVHQDVFELPYNPITLHEQSFLLLAARVNSFETGFKGLVSNLGVDYQDKGAFSGWAQYGVLDETYLATTYSIDDDVGILYTPYREDPIFSTISRTDLFSVSRFALLGTEIIRFQTVTPEGANSYRLTGVIRGVWNTPVAQHNAATSIWLFTITQNILQGITSDNFYVKMLPFFAGTVVDASLASAEHVIPTSKAATPWPPVRIVAVRSGADVSAEWWPTTQDKEGAGRASADVQTDQEPKVYDGDFETYYASTTHVFVDGTTRNYSQSGVHNFYVKARRNGYVSSSVGVLVEAGDGTYYGPVV